jgi:hypothetical protein
MSLECAMSVEPNMQRLILLTFLPEDLLAQISL